MTPLTAPSASKTYDGTALTNDSVEVTGDGFASGEGATYSVTGTRTLVGTSLNTFTYTLNGRAKEENYDISTVYGKLEVLNREAAYEVTVRANSGEYLYDGTEKGNLQDHVAVFDLPIEEYDLQQCADSVMRVYAEYFWATEKYDRIAFHFTSGFLAEYEKWRDGDRGSVVGNNVSWIKSKSPDSSYECFVKYLKSVFCYAGTLSMERESDPTTLAKLKVGDVFIYGGSPGHVVMVADVCENEQGKKAFLLAQGYMPAQEFHLLKNLLHEEDPWYYEEEVTYPFHTPEYTFQEGSLRSLKY